MSDTQLSTEDVLWLLSRPFAAHDIHWKVGATNKKARQRETGDQNAKPTKGQALAHVDARTIQNRLDAVVGPENWQVRYSWSDGNRVCCDLGIRLGDEWIWKSNGAGATDYEGDKGMFSDAFKRAAVMFAISRYLYALPAEWVDLNERGQLKNTPELPQWALPGEFQSKQERDKWITSLHKAWADRDDDAIRDIKNELSQEQQLDIWSAFTPTQRREIKEMLSNQEKAA